MIISEDQIKDTYIKLSIVEGLGALASGNDNRKYSKFLINGIVQVVGELLERVSKYNDNFSIEMFKEELTSGLNECRNDSELTSEFGELWLAEEDHLVKIIEIIAESAANQIIQIMKENYQAKFN